MFCKVGSAIFVCSSGWTVRRSCKPPHLSEINGPIIANTCCVVGSQEGVCKVFDGGP